VPARASGISSITGSSSVCTNSTHNYTAQNVTGAATYNWTVPSGATNQGGTAKSIDIQFPGVAAINQAITVTGSNACGTGPSRSLTGITISSCSREAVVTESMKAVIYPNPMNGKGFIFIETDVTQKVSIRMNDISGRQLMSETVEVLPGASTVELDVKSYPAGIYLHQLQTGDTEKTIRFMINN